jgi:hypothetical protein
MSRAAGRLEYGRSFFPAASQREFPKAAVHASFDNPNEGGAFVQSAATFKFGSLQSFDRPQHVVLEPAVRQERFRPT